MSGKNDLVVILLLLLLQSCDIIFTGDHQVRYIDVDGLQYDLHRRCVKGIKKKLKITTHEGYCNSLTTRYRFTVEDYEKCWYYDFHLGGCQTVSQTVMEEIDSTDYTDSNICLLLLSAYYQQRLDTTSYPNPYLHLCGDDDGREPTSPKVNKEQPCDRLTIDECFHAPHCQPIVMKLAPDDSLDVTDDAWCSTLEAVGCTTRRPCGTETTRYRRPDGRCVAFRVQCPPPGLPTLADGLTILPSDDDQRCSTLIDMNTGTFSPLTAPYCQDAVEKFFKETERMERDKNLFYQ